MAVIGASLVIENGYLTFEGTDGTIYINFSPFHTDIIDKIAGSEIITSIYNDVVGTDNFIRILFSQSCGIGIDLYIMVQGFKTFLGLDINPMVPTPAPVRYKATGDPRPPTPTISTLAC